MQIKSTVRYHVTPVGMAGIKKIRDNNVLARMLRKENPCTPLVKMQIGSTTMENSLEAPLKSQNQNTFSPSLLKMSPHLLDSVVSDGKSSVNLTGVSCMFIVLFLLLILKFCLCFLNIFAMMHLSVYPTWSSSC